MNISEYIFVLIFFGLKTLQNQQIIKMTVKKQYFLL